MIKNDQAPALIDGGTVVGTNGEEIGKVGQVYLDNQSGDVSWVTVKSGLFGTRESFVPTDDATVDGNVVTVPFGKDKIKDAPHASEAGEVLSPEQENDLYSYYGIGSGTSARDESVDYADREKTSAAAETPSPGDTSTGDSAYLTRSEEQLRVGTTQTEAGKARLRKYVVTEQQTVTVPVSHEEVHVIREPIAAGEAGTEIGEDQVEVTLHQDEVQVDKDVVGVEKVRLGTETVTEQQQVTESVRKEQIDTGDAVDASREDVSGPRA